MANGETIQTYEQFKQLNHDEQQFHIFNTLSSIRNLHNTFARKWVERAMVSIITITMSAVAIAILAEVVKS